MQWVKYVNVNVKSVLFSLPSFGSLIFSFLIKRREKAVRILSLSCVKLHNPDRSP